MSFGWGSATTQSGNGNIAMSPSGDYVVWADSATGAPVLAFRQATTGYNTPSVATLPPGAVVHAISIVNGTLTADLTIPFPAVPPSPTAPTTATYREGWLLWCNGAGHPATATGGGLVSHGGVYEQDFGSAIINVLCVVPGNCVTTVELDDFLLLDKIALSCILGTLAIGVLWRLLRAHSGAAERAHQASLAPWLAGFVHPSVAALGLADAGWLAGYGVLVGVYLWEASQTYDDGSWARALGSTTLPLLAVALMPSQRGSLWNVMLGLSFDRAVQWHKFAAVGFLALVIAHVVCVSKTDGLEEFTNDEETSYGHGSVYGTSSFALILATVALSLSPIRRHYWELFKFSHALLAPAAVGLACWHATRMFWYTLPAIALYALNKALTMYRSWRTWDASLTLVNATTARLTALLNPPLALSPGQFAFICVPAVSAVEWHPFSVASPTNAAGTTPTPTFVIHRVPGGEGSWTARLMAVARETKGTRVMIDGPYGRLSLKLERYSRVLFIAGGVGVTPFASIASELERLFHRRAQLRSARLVWAVREEILFSDALPGFLEWLDRSRLFMPSRLYVTGAKPADAKAKAEVVMERGRPAYKGAPEREMSVFPSSVFKQLMSQYESRLSETQRVGLSPAVQAKLGMGADPAGLRTMNKGRPNVHALVADEVREAMQLGSPASSVCVIVCGPQALIADAQAACGEIGAHCHHESFAF